MAKKYCLYQGCRNVRNVHGNITFFTLPNDERRSIWIENSGNEEFKFISDKSVRFICEEHFDRKYLRYQFSRTTLSRSAVPIHYSERRKNLKEKKQIAEYNMLFDPNDLQKKDINIVLKSVSGGNENETFEETSKDSIEYNVEYCDSDTNSDETEKLNEVNVVPDICEIMDRKNCSLDNEEESFVKANMLQGIDESDVFEYLEEENLLDTPIFEESTIGPPLKKIKKYLDVSEMQSCSSGEITSSTIETTQNETHNREINVLHNKISNNTSAKKIILNNFKKINTLKQYTLNNKVDDSITVPSEKDDYEEDMHFVLSLVGNFQRLPLQKKAVAKVKILQYLTNLEFGNCEPSNIIS